VIQELFRSNSPQKRSKTFLITDIAIPFAGIMKHLVSVLQMQNDLRWLDENKNLNWIFDEWLSDWLPFIHQLSENYALLLLNYTLLFYRCFLLFGITFLLLNYALLF
jgi:hypothetical protein